MMIKPPHPELLIHGQIPQPMHGVVPRLIKGQAWWDVERKAAYKKYQFHCWACGIHRLKAKYRQFLEGHERYVIDYEYQAMTFIGTCALCHSCHNFIHSGRMLILMEKGQFDPMKYHDIIAHGHRLMVEHGLAWPSELNEVGVWGRWRLILDGEGYPPKFASQTAWASHYDMVDIGDRRGYD